MVPPGKEKGLVRPTDSSNGMARELNRTRRADRTRRAVLALKSNVDA